MYAGYSGIYKEEFIESCSNQNFIEYCKRFEKLTYIHDKVTFICAHSGHDLTALFNPVIRIIGNTKYSIGFLIEDSITANEIINAYIDDYKSRYSEPRENDIVSRLDKCFWPEDKEALIHEELRLIKMKVEDPLTIQSKLEFLGSLAAKGYSYEKLKKPLEIIRTPTGLNLPLPNIDFNKEALILLGEGALLAKLEMFLRRLLTRVVRGELIPGSKDWIKNELYGIPQILGRGGGNSKIASEKSISEKDVEKFPEVSIINTNERELLQLDGLKNRYQRVALLCVYKNISNDGPMVTLNKNAQEICDDFDLPSKKKLSDEFAKYRKEANRRDVADDAKSRNLEESIRKVICALQYFPKAQYEAIEDLNAIIVRRRNKVKK